MRDTISATEARIHFGQLIREVVDNERRVVVERAGKPLVVVLSVADYERLTAGRRAPSNWLKEADEIRDLIRTDLKDNDLPPAEDIIRAMREERDAHLLDLR